MSAMKVNFNCCLIVVIITCVTLLSTQTGSAMALANCPPGCQCDDNLLVVQCGEGQLDVLPIALNPSIQRLVIRRNKIKTIDSSIQFYAELTFLDLSTNHILIIPQRTFAYQTKLRELHLSDNKIGQLTNRTFIGLSALTVLNLRSNLISELHVGAFNPLSRIEELNLGGNRIGYIDARAFEGLTQLRILYLDDNALTSVPDPVILQSMPRLAELMLGDNAMETISASAFENVGAGLTRLDLRGASLRNVSHEAFNALGSTLRYLDLSGNRLAAVPTLALSVLHRLEELTLGENDFEVIAEGAFVGLKQLKRLDISGAPRLKRVMHGAFATNTNLVHLVLASNKMLMEVQEGALSGLPHLRHVILKANALTSLAEGLFPWRDLITIDISENPLACDCRIMWLRNLLIMRNTSKSGSDMTSDDILCAFPERLRGEALRNLNPQLMGCLYGSEARRQALVGALLVGSAATITAITLIIYRCRRKIREYLQKSGAFGGRIKEREYKKTFCDEDYMTRLPSHGSHGNMSAHMLAAHHHRHHGVGVGVGANGGVGNLNHHHYMQHHATSCNMYTPQQQPYSMCTLDAVPAYKQEQQQQHHTFDSKKLIIDGNDNGMGMGQCASTCLDDSASFMMLMKANCSNVYQKQQQLKLQQQQQQKQSMAKHFNHYTKQTPSSLSSSNESSYSYVDVPLIHSVSAADHAHYRQQVQQNYRNDIDFNDASDDPNYIYSNAHYSLPLEDTTATTTSTISNETNALNNTTHILNSNNTIINAKLTPIPPALPLRNSAQARRSFNLNYKNNNDNINHIITASSINNNNNTKNSNTNTSPTTVASNTDANTINNNNNNNNNHIINNSSNNNNNNYNLNSTLRNFH